MGNSTTETAERLSPARCPMCSFPFVVRARGGGAAAFNPELSSLLDYITIAQDSLTRVRQIVEEEVLP